jgi:hypothetical protein
MLEFLTIILIFVTVIYVYFTYQISKANEQAVAVMQQQITVTRRVAEATLVKEFANDYFTYEMSWSLRILRKWKEQNGDQFASIWLTRLHSDDIEARKEAHKVDKARRYVAGYFEKAARIFSVSLIRQQAFRAIAYAAGINIYYDVIDPLTFELNPERSPQTIEILLSQCGRYTEGEQVRPVPPGP